MPWWRGWAAPVTRREEPREMSIDRLKAHLEICRVDHWFKNVFVLPGTVVALAFEPEPVSWGLLADLLIALVAVGLVASANYTINEVLDARFDRLHPAKRDRPVPSGRVHIGWATVQWISLGLGGVTLALWVSVPLALVTAALFGMGCVYNVPPLRSKELPYLDVLSESVNNPLRMLAGWYVVGPDAFVPGSLLMSYWMVGAYFMAMKRFAEYRQLGDPELAASYRRSFRYYDESTLLVSIMFYAAASMLMLGAFIVRYRMALILAAPFVALVMAQYLKIGLQPDSPVQNPEKLYRQRSLMISTTVCAAVLIACLFIDLPLLGDLLAPTAPTEGPPR